MSSTRSKKAKRKAKGVVDKEEMCAVLAKTTKVNKTHVYAILGIFLDEIERDLCNGKVVKISNFGSFELRRMLPKRQFNVTTGKSAVRERGKVLRFVLDRSFSRFISEFIE